MSRRGNTDQNRRMGWFGMFDRSEDPMGEYLLSNADGTGLPAIHKDDLARLLVPAGWPSEQIAGWGDHRLRIGGAEVAVSGEETGWHVVIRGTVPPPGEAALIAALAGRISAAAGHDVKVTEL